MDSKALSLNLVVRKKGSPHALQSVSGTVPGTLPPDTSETVLTRPYLNDRGELIIPFDCDPRYHWWADGQSVAQTLAELNAPPEVWGATSLGTRKRCSEEVRR